MSTAQWSPQDENSSIVGEQEPRVRKEVSLAVQHVTVTARVQCPSLRSEGKRGQGRPDSTFPISPFSISPRVKSPRANSS